MTPHGAHRPPTRRPKRRPATGSGPLGCSKGPAARAFRMSTRANVLKETDGRLPFCFLLLWAEECIYAAPLPPGGVCGLLDARQPLGGHAAATWPRLWPCPCPCARSALLHLLPRLVEVPGAVNMTRSLQSFFMYASMSSSRFFEPRSAATSFPQYPVRHHRNGRRGAKHRSRNGTPNR